MKDFLATYGWNLLALFAATKLLALGYFWQFQKKQVTLSLVPVALLLFLLVAFASFEENISIGLGILGVLSFIRLRSTIDSLTDAVTLLTAVIFGILAAEISDIWWLVAAYGLVLLTFAGMAFWSRLAAPYERKQMQITLDELVLLPSDTDCLAFKKRLEKEFGITVLQFRVLSVDYVRDASKISIEYVAKS